MNLLQDVDSSMSNQLPWYGIHVKSRFERVTSAVLQTKGYNPFVPVHTVRRRWTDRIKEVELPLFPGYVFCRLDATNRLPVLTAPGVVGIVGIGKAPTPIEEQEIEAIRTIIAARLMPQPWLDVSMGDRVKIAYGPLRGIEGTVANVKNGKHLVVSITLLQRAISVVMDETWVRSPG